MKQLLAMIKYALLTMKHKWFIMVVGRKLGLSWMQILLHDVSKLSWKELPGYGRQFFGSKDNPRQWAEAWLHHQNTNPHHVEYWLIRSGTKNFPSGCPMPMPKKYVIEAVCDWMAASRAYENKWPEAHHWAWFDEHFKTLDLHVDSRTMILGIIKKIWGFVPVDGEDFEVKVSR